MPDLTGKTAVITGGSRGIGAASARALAAAGANVHLTYHQSKTQAQALVDEIRAAGGQASCAALDATKPASVNKWAAQVGRTLGRVDVLFNNAGDLVQRASIEQQTPQLVRRIMDLNVLSTILVTQALLPRLTVAKSPGQPGPQGGGGVIINMASLAARNGGNAGAATYAASKGAIVSMALGWAKELASRGIRVFAVCPGVIATDFHERHSTPQFMQGIARMAPLGRVGVAEDVARVVAFLAGQGDGYMTGTTFDINGGLWLG